MQHIVLLYAFNPRSIMKEVTKLFYSFLFMNYRTWDSSPDLDKQKKPKKQKNKKKKKEEKKERVQL